MTNFFKSFSPLLKRLKLKKYVLEITLLTIAIIITIISLVIYAKNAHDDYDKEPPTNDQLSQILPEKIFVEVSGAIKKPNLYEMNFGARIKEIIDRAGGLSEDADVIFFNRNFNLARILVDQEKIYIPSISEINSGIFIQNQMVLDYNSPSVVIKQNTLDLGPSENQSLININNSTIEELDQLPGIGQVTANKILKNRPYSTLEELLTKKILNKGVFDKMKNLISL